MLSDYRESGKANGQKHALRNLQSCKNIFRYSIKDVPSFKGCQKVGIRILSCPCL